MSAPSCLLLSWIAWYFDLVMFWFNKKASPSSGEILILLSSSGVVMAALAFAAVRPVFDTTFLITKLASLLPAWLRLCAVARTIAGDSKQSLTFFASLYWALFIFSSNGFSVLVAEVFDFSIEEVCSGLIILFLFFPYSYAFQKCVKVAILSPIQKTKLTFRYFDISVALNPYSANICNFFLRYMFICIFRYIYNEGFVGPLWTFQNIE